MVADMMKCSTKRVTQSLEGIGMEVRQKRLARAKGTRNTRALLVPDEKKWQEMVQRYYIPEDGEEILMCPECLKGPEYGTRQQLFPDSGALSSSVLSNEGLGEETADEKAMEPSFGSLQEWLSYHGFDQALPVEQYVLISHEDRAGLFCRCKGCQEPGRSRPMYGILERPYNQICQKHYDEMKGLSSDIALDELSRNT